MVIVLSEVFWRKHLPTLSLKPIGDFLKTEGFGIFSVPYLGYIHVTISFAGVDEQTCSVLIAPDTPYNQKVPLLVGTNLLRVLEEDLQHRLGVQFPQRCSLPSSLDVRFHYLSLRERHLRKSGGTYDVVKSCSHVVLKLGEVKFVPGCSKFTVHIASKIALAEAARSDLPFCVTHGFVSLADVGSVELCNPTDTVVNIQSGSVICELHDNTLEESASLGSEEDNSEFLSQFDLDHLD